MTKFAPHQALKSITLRKLTFDVGVVLHRVGRYIIDNQQAVCHQEGKEKKVWGGQVDWKRALDPFPSPGSLP